jgi:hypothetical protein
MNPPKVSLGDWKFDIIITNTEVFNVFQQSVSKEVDLGFKE